MSTTEELHSFQVPLLDDDSTPVLTTVNHLVVNDRSEDYIQFVQAQPFNTEADPDVVLMTRAQFNHLVAMLRSH